MLKTVGLLNIFVETMLFFFQETFQKKSSKEKNLVNLFLFFFANNIKVFTFDQFNASLLNQSICVFLKKKQKNRTDPKSLNG